jgi:dTMP kinase
MKKGLFITFEGPEGSGKSTQIKKVAAYLKKSGRKVLLLREPGGTRISEAARAIILNKAYTEMAPETELLLYLAARAQIVHEKILPALKKGMAVICDRFEDSTLAYQGYGRGLSAKAIEDVSRLFVRGRLQPDLTILLDIDPKQGMKRGGRHDRMERQSDLFHRKVRQGFLDLARRNRRRFRVIDAALPIETVASLIQRVLKPWTRKK